MVDKNSNLATPQKEKENKMSSSSPDSSFDLNTHIFRLLIDEPFFAGISRRINKVANSSIPTAGVWVNPSTAQFEFLYNPNFMNNLNDVQRKGVIKHELYHLIFEHVTGRAPLKPANPQKPTREEAYQLKLWNYAADLAINSHIANELPENCCIPGKEGTPFESLPAGLSAEAYLTLLKKLIEENKKNKSSQNKGSCQSGNGNGSPSEDLGDDANDGNGSQFDDHGKWSDENDENADSTKEMAQERIKDIMRKAAQEAGEAGRWGSISNKTRQDILERISPKIDWRKLLRYFVKTSQRSHKSSTVRKINKRFPYIHPGKKINRTAKIIVCIDQSGSVSDAMLGVFFSELASLSKIAEFTMLYFDTEVDESSVVIWKKGNKFNPSRTRCGGTDFNAPTEYVNKHSFYDGCIILTDLEAPKPKACKVPRLWITDETHGSRPYFQTNEVVVKIPNKELKKHS